MENRKKAIMLIQKKYKFGKILPKGCLVEIENNNGVLIAYKSTPNFSIGYGVNEKEIEYLKIL